MEFNTTREQWVDRFVIRMSALRSGAEPDDFNDLAHRLWPAQGHIAAEAAAEAEARRPEPAHADFANTESPFEGSPFEKTQRIPVERVQTEGGYVRDNEEWIARCAARVLELDPIIKADEARRSVSDLAALERWRLMKPEAAADQLYTPVKLRPA